MKVVVVIPTYNERMNIGPLIDEIQRQGSALSHDLAILVVDDSSPDGTGDWVRQRATSQPDLHVLSGRKCGLGSAYVRGMQHAMDHLEADWLVQMDADFSHSPLDVPRLIAALEAGADFVVGSRYVAGASIPSAWHPWRRGLSVLANRVLSGTGCFPGLQDCTGGFRAMRAQLVKEVDLTSLNVSGYAFQVALLHEVLRHGGRVQEVPVAFSLRSGGCSKLGWRDMAEFGLLLGRIVLRTFAGGKVPQQHRA